MSDADSAEEGGDFGDLSPVEIAAARGELPAWARAGLARREHMARVAALLEGWAYDLGLPEVEALRWAAAGWLHDALRDADPKELRREVPGDFRSLPAPLLHGPAAASRLEGSVHPNVSVAIRFHTVGHPSLDELGRALYLADFLEPGRKATSPWHTELRARMPLDRHEVLIEVLSARIRHLLDDRIPIRPETAEFWSSTVSGTGR